MTHRIGVFIRAVTAVAATCALLWGTQVHAQARGAVTIAINSLGPETWWPQDIAGNKYISSTIGDPLLRLVSPYQIEPAIASSWSVTPNGLTYEFTIRDDVFFHDGTKLTAEDVAFSLSPANVEKFVGFSAMKGGNLLGVEAKGNRVTMRLKTPVPMMIDLYIVRISIWPKAYVERVGAEGFNRRPIGAGPFRFVEHAKGQYVKMEAFDRYYGDKPKVKDLTWRVVPEPATRMAMLRAGEADVTYNELGTGTVELRKNRFRAQPYGQPTQNVLIFNSLVQRDIPKSRFEDVRIRQALALAVDRKAIGEAIYGGIAEPASLLIIGAKHPGFDKRFIPLPYDAARARKLLADAGFPQGFETELVAGTDMKDMATLLVSFWEKIGVKARLKLLDPASLRRNWYQHKLEGDGILLASALATGVASLVYLDPKAQVALNVSPELGALRDAGMTISDIPKQNDWLRSTLAPAMEKLLPAVPVLEHPEGVIGLGPKVKSWDKHDGHSLGLQWLIPAD